MVNATNGNEKVWNINLFAHKSTLNTFDKVELRLALLASMHDLDSLFLLVWTSGGDLMYSLGGDYFIIDQIRCVMQRLWA